MLTVNNDLTVLLEEKICFLKLCENLQKSDENVGCKPQIVHQLFNFQIESKHYLEKGQYHP